MKKFSAIIFLLAGGICSAQNLVPNGDFEQYSACPTDYGQINLALPWFTPTAGTPDYFNACVPNGNWDVPNNGMGVRAAHSGQAYAGIVLYDTNQVNGREYIEVPLLSPLTGGELYHFEMYVGLGQRAYFRTDAIQAYFSDTLITGINSTLVLPFTPQISNTPGNFFNPSTWTLVSGNYLAQGGESYLLIGNFKNNASTAVAVNGGNFGVAYTYIEDVSVTIITGINQFAEDANINLFPNPFNDYLKLNAGSNELLEIVLYDVASRKMLQQKFTESVSLNTSVLEGGLYFYVIRNSKGIIKQGRLVKQ